MRKRSNSQVRCAIYLRCSTDDQKEGDFTTIDTQREINRDYVAQQGWLLTGEYADEGKSGTSMNRPDLRRLIADAEAGVFDVVCVTYMSRLGRGNPFVIAEYELGKHGVRVEMVREKFTDDLAGYLGKTVTTMMDGVYPKMVSGWTKTKMQEMVAKGYFCGGSVPFGCRPEAIEGMVNKDGEPIKRLVPSADAEIVRCAFGVYLEKGTIAAVRAYLKSVTTARKWTATSVKNLLTNEVYAGVLTFGNWRNESAYEPIVDRETFDTVQERIDNISAGRKARPTTEFTYYLRGRIRCPHCGCPYTHASAHGRSGRVHYYACLNANKYGGKCPVVRINAEKLHYTVLHQIQRAATHHTVMHKLIAQSGGWGEATENQKAVRGQLAKLKQQLEMRIVNYTNAIGDGRLSPAIASALAKAEEELEVVSEKLMAAEDEIAGATVKRPTADQVQALWSEVVDLWDDLTEPERTELMMGVVKDVQVQEKHRVLMELSPIPEVHGAWFAIKSNMGAGVGLEPTTFGL